MLATETCPSHSTDLLHCYPVELGGDYKVAVLKTYITTWQKKKNQNIWTVEMLSLYKPIIYRKKKKNLH